MKEYLLFIDTETSGLPADWNAPYSKPGNWPFTVQLSWLIFNRNGEELKRENHYINNENLLISEDAIKIHGITAAQLADKGENRTAILQMLQNDLDTYQPLVVGHFMELDFHVIGADCYRCKLDNPLKNRPLFCTMLATTHLLRTQKIMFLRLEDLYEYLFHTSFQHQHNALADALATSACFFELIKRGDITEDQVCNQQRVEIEPRIGKTIGFILLLLIICGIILIFLSNE